MRLNSLRLFRPRRVGAHLRRAPQSPPSYSSPPRRTAPCRRINKATLSSTVGSEQHSLQPDKREPGQGPPSPFASSATVTSSGAATSIVAQLRQWGSEQAVAQHKDPHNPPETGQSGGPVAASGVVAKSRKEPEKVVRRGSEGGQKGGVEDDVANAADALPAVKVRSLRVKLSGDPNPHPISVVSRGLNDAGVASVYEAQQMHPGPLEDWFDSYIGR
eukprot:252090-Prorocentrum_minimum.AAC.1